MSEWADQYFEAWNSHDPERVGTHFADDATYESVGAGPLFIVKGRDAIKAMVSALDRYSNDSKITLLSELRSEDRFVFEMEETGTNTGRIARGVPATNKRYTVRLASIGRLDGNGKIIEERVYTDRLDIFTQLGLLTAPGA
jgi:steroid delta-isomerase-like uncharacterized protein